MTKSLNLEKSGMAIWNFICANVLDLLTLAVAGYIFISSNVSNFLPEQLLVQVIGILTLIAFSNLVYRGKLKKIECISEETNASLHSIIEELLLFYDPEDIKQGLKDSKQEIILIGNSLKTTLDYFSGLLIERIDDGVNIRMLLMDYKEDRALDVNVNGYIGERDNKFSKLSLVNSMRKIYHIFYTKNSDKPGELVLGLVPFPLKYGLVIIDPSEKNSMLFVKFYGYMNSSQRVMLVVKKEKQPKMFDYFYQQAESIWSNCAEKGRIISEFDEKDLPEVLIK